MVVQHNLSAMNANRMSGITTGQQVKASEKLSFEYQINRVTDDAVGLSISEKMKKQVEELKRTSTKAQDSMSSVQVAEEALSKVHGMLQQMRDLSHQAKSATNSVDDRDGIQSKISQLTTEINRVAETTQFNGTYLLKGNGTPGRYYPKGHDAGLEGNFVDETTTAQFTIQNLQDGDTINIAGTKYTIGATEDLENDTITQDIAYNKIKTELLAANSIGTTGQKASVSVTIVSGQTTFNITKGFANISEALSFALHVGADADLTNKVTVDIQSMNVANLGIDEINVSDDTGRAATYAKDAITDAIEKVSKQRTALENAHNRLEQSITNLDDVKETTLSDEMIENAKNNILAQAGQAMLAQANSFAGGVLSLLQ